MNDRGGIVMRAEEADQIMPPLAAAELRQVVELNDALTRTRSRMSAAERRLARKNRRLRLAIERELQ